MPQHGTRADPVVEFPSSPFGGRRIPAYLGMNNPTAPQAPNALARVNALAAHLDIDADTIEASDYNPHAFECPGGREWLVLTDEEADEAAGEYIDESLWAFNADFVAGYMPKGIEADTVRAIVGDRCEDANDAIRSLIEAGDGLEALTNAAIAADGRGHFLAHYDHEEVELPGGLFAYRTN